MRIYTDIKLKGASNEIIINALIDSGAEISLMPLRIAQNIGAWKTNEYIDIKSVHEEIKECSIIIAELYFISLNLVGGQFRFAMSDVAKEVIIGMDILKPLGITIDTKSNSLSIKNEILEAFKTLSTVGVITYGTIKLLDWLS
jgi:predicted aspartyl protease